MPEDFPPFIATQKLYALRLDDYERVNTRGFLLQGALPESDAPTNDESSPQSPRSHWVHEPNRYEFLANEKRRLLCITVSAGIGKTKALEQFVIAQQAEHPERLVIRLHVSRLPDSWELLLDGPQSILADIVMEQIGETDQDRSQKTIPIKSKPIVAHWLRSLARIGNLTLAIDGLDEIDQVNGEAKTQALKVFLEKHPRVGCTVAGRPYSITNYYWPLFSDSRSGTESGPSSDWKFCLIGTFEQNEVEQYLGAALYRNVAGFLNANMLFVPRTLEMLHRLTPQEAKSIRSAADVYWRSIEKTLTEDIAKPGLRKQTYLTQNEIIDMLSAVAVTMVMWNHDPLVTSIQRREETWTEVRDGLFPCSPVRQIGRTDYEFLKTLFIERIQSIYKWDVSKCARNLDELIKINCSFVEFAFFNSADANHIDWRNASVRDFFAALWMVRASNHNEQRWFAHRQSVVFKDEETISRYSELNDLWKFLCAIPGDSFLRRSDAYGLDGRWLTLITNLFSRVPHVRATELMFVVWPHLLLRAGFDIRIDWSEEDVSRATQAAQLAASSSTQRLQEASPTTSLSMTDQLVVPRTAVSIVHNFLTEFLDMSSHFHENHDILHEDMLNHFRDCNSSAGLTFRCGHADERKNPERDLVLDEGFQLCAYQVTNRLYACFDPHHAMWFNRDEVEGKYDLCSPYPRGPAIYVNWYDAMMLATWSNSRLPTEWEWEYACRANKKNAAGHNAVFYWGDEEEQLEQHAWIESNSTNRENKLVNRVGRHAHTVGTPSAEHPYGLYDILGNVWEWCSNRSDEHVRRSHRGGSFFDDAIYTHCSKRFDSDPSVAWLSHGVRLARAGLRKS